MKRKNILRISILPLILFTVLALTDMQPQKNKEQGRPEAKGKSDGNQDNNDRVQGNQKTGQGNNQDKNSNNQGNNNNQGKDNQGKNNQGNKNNEDYGKPGKDEKGNADKRNNNSGDGMKIKRGNGNSKTMNGNRDQEINWGFNDFTNRKGPKNQKKVTICHHPSASSSDYPVTINISENAVQAHMNHGDQMGNCTTNYSDRWSSNYIQSRENVYNTYEQTWETMSYSEALLKYAMEKLLGVRTNLSSNRANLSNQDIQRREVIILDLQNNVTSLENQLNLTRQKLDSDVNIIVQL